MNNIIMMAIAFFAGFLLSPLHKLVKLKLKQSRIEKMEKIADLLVDIDDCLGITIMYKNDNVSEVRTLSFGYYIRYNHEKDRKTGIFKSLSRSDIKHLAMALVETGEVDVIDLDRESEKLDRRSAELMRKVK